MHEGKDTETLDFTDEIDKVKDFISELKAKGGRDICEDVIGGFKEGL